MIHFDFFKAYDSMELNVLIKILDIYGFGSEILKMIEVMYKFSNGFININNKKYNQPINITKGVRQGDVISPLLYLYFINPLITELEQSELGYQLSSKLSIPVVAYCDDIVIVSDSLVKIHKLARIVKRF